METRSPALQRFNSLLKETDKVYHEAALALGLSDSAMWVLYALWEGEGSLPLRELCRTCGLTKQTVNSALRKLEEAGALSLEPMSHREKRVGLTTAGMALAARTAGRVMAAENAVYDRWDPEDVGKYLELTERYMRQLREELRKELKHE